MLGLEVMLLCIVNLVDVESLNALNDTDCKIEMEVDMECCRPWQ